MSRTVRLGISAEIMYPYDGLPGPSLLPGRPWKAILQRLHREYAHALSRLVVPALIASCLIAGCTQPNASEYTEFAKHTDGNQNQVGGSHNVAAEEERESDNDSPGSANDEPPSRRADASPGAIPSQADTIPADPPSAATVSAAPEVNLDASSDATPSVSVATGGDRAGSQVATGPRKVRVLVKERRFKAEGPENVLRITYDDFDLLKVLNMAPVTPNAPELMPDWLKDLHGKRVRVRGFMYPPFEETGLRGFVLARDNQICCFGRNPKIYDLVEVTMRDGVTTDYIANRPFDVVGIFRIDATVDDGKLYRLYQVDDALVIDR